MNDKDIAWLRSILLNEAGKVRLSSLLSVLVCINQIVKKDDSYINTRGEVLGMVSIGITYDVREQR